MVQSLVYKTVIGLPKGSTEGDFLNAANLLIHDGKFSNTPAGPASWKHRETLTASVIKYVPCEACSGAGHARHGDDDEDDLYRPLIVCEYCNGTSVVPAPTMEIEQCQTTSRADQSTSDQISSG